MHVSSIFLLLIYYSLRRKLIFISGVEIDIFSLVLYIGVITSSLQTQRSKADIFYAPSKTSLLQIGVGLNKGV